MLTYKSVSYIKLFMFFIWSKTGTVTNFEKSPVLAHPVCKTAPEWILHAHSQWRKLQRWKL